MKDKSAIAAALLSLLAQDDEPRAKRKDSRPARSKRRRQSSAKASPPLTSDDPPKGKTGAARIKLVKPIREEVIAAAKSGGKRQKLDEPPPELVASFFKPYQPPPGVVPKDTRLIAMDDNSNVQQISTWAQSSFGQYWKEGLAWPGYAYLSELTLRPEYRVISQVIATEMTRKWITFQSVSSEEDDKSDKIKELNDEFDRLNVRDHFYYTAEMDGWMGRSHLYLDTGNTDDPDELKTDIGDGRNKTTEQKFKKGDLKGLKVIEPVWTYPQDYNSTDPLKPSWYHPSMWFVMSKQVHASRLLTFIGRPVPDILKPAYAFGGLSLSQISKPYVDNWLQTRQSVNDIIRAFSVMVLGTDMSSVLSASDSDGSTGNGSALLSRVDLFNALRDNRGTFVIDKETEDFKNVSAPLSSLDALQAQSQEHMASVSRIPLTKLLGITPHGLNASSEGEIKAFYDTINAFQEVFFRPNLTRVSHFAQMNLWGKVDPDIIIKFEDLWAMSEKELAEIRKIDAETDDILVNGCAALGPEDVRKRVASDPDTPHDGLDVDKLPEPPDFSGAEGKPNVKGITAFGKGPASMSEAEGGGA